MSPSDPLQLLLDQLCQGDPEAARLAFVTYEPYLRMVVRRQLSGAMRTRFDSLDIVQSVWADLLGGFRAGAWSFESTDQLRSFLVRATLNRLVDRSRRERNSLSREQSIDPDSLGVAAKSDGSAAGERLEADELWEQMVERCPPQHRELLALRREGLPLAEIAARTGLHESSVRRVLYELAARIAARQT
jgi:RNA polymerase sigma-70 factor (ECF subfamily)